MVDRILVFLASVALAILITLGTLNYKEEYDILIGIFSIAGFVLAVYNFIRLRK